MFVTLLSVPNPDYDEIYAPAPEFNILVADLIDASKVCQDYIEKYNLGSGNWAGGNVIEDYRKIAYISYNGRIWEKL